MEAWRERAREIAEALDAYGVEPVPASGDEGPAGPGGPGLHDVYAALMRIEDGIQRIESRFDELLRERPGK